MFCTRCGTEVDNRAKFCPSCGLDLASTTPLAAIDVGAGIAADAAEIDLVRDALKQEYEILEELGRGGMAIVFRASERQLDREVAIKALPFSLAFDQEFVERFQREARTSARLEHPNIIPIYRVGTAGRVIYFVMKFLRGASLSDLLDEVGSLPPNEIRRILIQTASALGYAHKHEIVHRDVKPDNIMFDELGNVVVTDFGIAKAASGTRLTGTGMSIGTPHYMSPEQARAQPLDGRSDIYSLGVVAFQSLTGHVPFDGEDSFAIGYKHIMEELPSPPFHSAEQRSLFTIIEKMMAKSPDDRFQTADDLIAALEGRVAVERPVRTTVSEERPTSKAATRRPAMRRPRTLTTTPTTPIPQAQPRPAKRSGALVGMFLLLLLGGGGAGGYWYFMLDGHASVQRLLVGGAPVADGLVGGDIADSLTAAATDTGAPAPDDAATARDTARPAGPSMLDLPNTGTVILRGVPGLATVRVDGDLRTSSTMTVPAGSHRIEVTMLGHEKFDTTVAVARGDTVAVPVTLVRAQATGQPRGQLGPRPPAPLANVCAEPGPAYNAGDACFDVPPSPVRACVIPIPEDVNEQPTPVVLWVFVRADSTAGRMQRVRDSSVGAFTLRAIRFARTVRYSTAIKEGQPVDAWLRLTCQAVPR